MPSDRLPTDVVLLRLHGPQPETRALAQRLAALPACRNLGATLGRCAWSAEAGMASLSVTLAGRIALTHLDAAALAGAANSADQIQVARLTLMKNVAGHGSDTPAPFHDVVEMTPEAGFGVELQRWYDEEHLPGLPGLPSLAGAPGCVRAQRFWNHDTGPQPLACYDLVAQETLGSPEWLAVRNTPWSDRMRPRFTQTVRTMFTTLR